MSKSTFFVDVSKTVCCEPLVFSIIPESRFFAMQNGEPFLTATGDTYTLKNVPLTEGECNLTFELKGAQTLDHGVYLYLSEVAENPEDPDDPTSQTMVGVAEGERSVNVSMLASLNLDVDDEVYSIKRFWRRQPEVRRWMYPRPVIPWLSGSSRF